MFDRMVPLWMGRLSTCSRRNLVCQCLSNDSFKCEESLGGVCKLRVRRGDQVARQIAEWCGAIYVNPLQLWRNVKSSVSAGASLGKFILDELHS